MRYWPGGYVEDDNGRWGVIIDTGKATIHWFDNDVENVENVENIDWLHTQETACKRLRDLNSNIQQFSKRISVNLKEPSDKALLDVIYDAAGIASYVSDMTQTVLNYMVARDRIKRG